jgi:acyl-CoA synthetase (AMP-forming)/AMP-acid ligase II/1-acyl-sn-glycerol-3-phosphate acyltransferase/acyl carrier protein
MASSHDEALREQIRRARSKFIAMAVTYSLGVLNDNLFREAALLMAVSARKPHFQGVATALFALPYLLFGAPAGWMADRFMKHRVVIWAKALEVAAMTCGAVAVCTHSWGLILAMVFLMGSQSAVFSPSLNGSIPELYPASYVTAANAKLKVATTGAILLGVGLAGVALGRKGVALSGVPRGQLIVAIMVLGISLLGLLSSFGVPRRPAADPRARFPWSGPTDSLAQLWGIRRDGMLAAAVAGTTFIFFLGSVELLIINELGLKQYGLTETLTGVLIFAQLVGLALGGLLSSRLTRGRCWYRLLIPGALGICASLLMAAHVTLLPGSAQVPLLFALLGAAGLFGGLMLIPCEAFIQTRPAPERKGTVIAAANFAVFAGILLSGPAAVGLLAWQPPSVCFGVLAALALFVALVLLVELPPGRGHAADVLLAALARGLFRLRYRIEVTGLDAVAARGTDSILFLPNHPALIDPPIMLSMLFRRFAPRIWADQDQIDRPIIRSLAPRFGIVSVPAATRYGAGSRSQVQRALDLFIRELRNGNCVLLYPSGHAYRNYLEDLRGNTAVHAILRELPRLRVVLVRTRGLWGSRFSWASGRPPDVGRTLKQGAVALLANGIFFGPRRRVTIEFAEPNDLPREAAPDVLESYLEHFYNADAPRSTYVPYTIWEPGGVRHLPEPFIGVRRGDVGSVPEATRQIVVARLRQLTGAADVRDSDDLARELGIDSLTKVELTVWVQEEFGFTISNSETLETVGDLLLAACGEAVAGEPMGLKPVPARWFSRSTDGGRLTPAEGDTVTAAFLNAARRAPGRAIIADQASGVRTYRDLIAAIFVLRPAIQRLPGTHVGIMLPASAGAAVTYLATLFAGKTPVMVNWTLGSRNVVHALETVGVRHLLTARALVSRIAGPDVGFGELSPRFLFLEDIGRAVPWWAKLGAWVRARLYWGSLDAAKATDPAVILFTSGSESLPKAVPLTHGNVLANVRAVCSLLTLRPQDSAMGILPPFHSFGLTVTVLTPLCLGMPTVYHPDPMEAGMVGRLIEAYGVSLLIGTPTFLHGIVRASTNEQLQSVRLAVTGAEKCSDRVYDALAERCPQAVVLEGYGVTECAPIISLNEERAPRRGTIGKVLPLLEHAIVDVDSGEPVTGGRPGMLLVRGPSVFSGYLNYEGEPPFVAFAGREWYCTGDLVSEDAQGVLSFAGRLKRFTKLGGEMISLPAIEAVLQRHYVVEGQDAPVIAVEATVDDRRPEIVLFTSLDIDRETANGHLRGAGLSALHNIRRVIRLDSIPVLGTGKTDYRALRAALGADRDAPVDRTGPR